MHGSGGLLAIARRRARERQPQQIHPQPVHKACPLPAFDLLHGLGDVACAELLWQQ
jgi:hypothetical protein